MHLVDFSNTLRRLEQFAKWIFKSADISQQTYGSINFAINGILRWKRCSCCCFQSHPKLLSEAELGWWFYFRFVVHAQIKVITWWLWNLETLKRFDFAALPGPQVHGFLPHALQHDDGLSFREERKLLPLRGGPTASGCPSAQGQDHHAAHQPLWQSLQLVSGGFALTTSSPGRGRVTCFIFEGMLRFSVQERVQSAASLPGQQSSAWFIWKVLSVENVRTSFKTPSLFD